MQSSFKKKKFKPGRFLVLIALVVFAFYYALFYSSSTLNYSVAISDGDTFWTFLKPLSSWDSLRLKLFVKYYPSDMSRIQQGNYVFSWSYTPQSFVAHIAEWVKPEYVSYTVLEGRSIYDIDYDLTQKGLLKQWEYIAYVQDKNNIAELSQKYDFLTSFWWDSLTTLEWFLYPDTYFLDEKQDVLSQLVSMQLDTFGSKVRKKLESWFVDFSKRLQLNGYNNVSLNYYDLLILATVVEKEERNDKNKSTIAWLFLNRLKTGERIDADISLCYWLQEPYEICTPDIIVKHLYDANNPYNTRAVFGLPPTPIANPSVASMSAVLSFVATDYYFYLHDGSGQIHFARSISEHNANKSKYLN